MKTNLLPVITDQLEDLVKQAPSFGEVSLTLYFHAGRLVRTETHRSVKTQLSESGEKP